MEVYTAELIDGETANIFLEEVDETFDVHVTRVSRDEVGAVRGVHPSEVVLGKVWEYVIRIGGHELYGRRLGFKIMREALNHAWKRLDAEQGVMPGARPVRQ